MASWEEFSRIVAEAKAAKKLDPVGKEDDDVNNDDKVDSTDDYLKNRRSAVGAAIAADKKKKSEKDSDEMCEAKVDEKLPEHERATARDKRSGHNLPGSGTRRVRRSEHEERRGKPKRWWDDDGDGIGYEKGEVKKEEVEYLDEFLGTGRVVAARSRNTNNINPGSRYTEVGTVQKVFGRTLPGSFQQGASQSDVARHNRAASPQSQIKKTNVSDDQLVGRKPGGQLTAGITPDKKPRPAAPKPAAAPDKKPTFAEKGREMRRQIDARNSTLTQAIKGINNSYQPEGEMVEEDKEYRREMRKAAARERAEEKSERKEEGKRSAKAPGRLGKSAGTSYADKEQLSIKGHDEVTKKAKHTVGNPFPEHYMVDGEYIEEMPYQVYGSHDGKTEKKIGKPVKSRKYAHDRADELSDTHKETGGKFRVQKEENDIDEGMSMKDFKSNRKKLQRKEASVDAEKRGHVGKEWHNTGNKYTPDQAKANRTKLTDDDRAARHRVAVDPDDDRDENTYSADKTKNPKKLRKQKAMGEAVTGGSAPNLPTGVLKFVDELPQKVTSAAKKVKKIITKEEYIEEKSLSRAQQRFMGMVYAAKKGEPPASPEVAKAASGMSKKSARDFAKTKHEGLPEKKEEVKEFMSLVQRIIAEATDAQWMAAKARRDEREKEQRRRMKQAKLNTAAVKAMKDESERKENARDESKSKRGKSALTGAERAEAIRTAGRVKTAKIYQQIEREKRLEKKEREKRESEEEKKKTKKRQRKELRSDIKNALSSPIKVSASEKDTDVASAVMSNVGSLVGSVAKVGGALAKYGVKRAWTKRQERKESQSKEKENQKEEFSNWREEFIFEVDDQSVKNEKQKVIDVSKKKNKIEINPNMSEGCGCEDKEEKKETPKKDMRDLPTKVNLLKTKARAMGARNPIVMVASEETDNIQEIAPLLAGVARIAGGAVARGVTSRVAGTAAKGSLRSRAAEIIGQQAGERIENMFTNQPSQSNGGGESILMTKLEKQLKTEGAAWTKKEGKSEAGGLNEKGRKSYERENPGSDLKAPSKEVGNPRRASFCARMSGMKAKLTSKKTANDPDSRINKSLRAWNC
jgi:hypothetical protein